MNLIQDDILLWSPLLPYFYLLCLLQNKFIRTVCSNVYQVVFRVSIIFAGLSLELLIFPPWQISKRLGTIQFLTLEFYKSTWNIRNNSCNMKFLVSIEFVGSKLNVMKEQIRNLKRPYFEVSQKLFRGTKAADRLKTMKGNLYKSLSTLVGNVGLCY